VNFYIFNSKYKRNILLFIFIFIIFIFIIDITLYYLIEKKTTEFRFVDELSSKSKHMLLNGKDKDVVFIGSSRTFYQIDTNYFNLNGLNSYNYGISGRHTPNYSFMTDNALKIKPKCIVFGLDAEKLYQPIERYMDFPTISDIKQFIESGQDIDDVIKAIVKFLKNLHYLNTYDTVIYEKMKILLTKLIPQKQLGVLSRSNKKVENNYDCDYFDIAYNRGSHQHETLVKCKNGDGIIYGNALDKLTGIKSLENYDKNHLLLYNSILKKISNNGIKTITIFTPRYQNPFEFKDKEKLISIIKSDIIIDMTEVSIPMNMWGDNAHLNIFGRTWYSEYIYKKIKNHCR